MEYEKLLRSKMSSESYNRLVALSNPKVMEFIGFFAEHCDPDSIYVCNDSEEDMQYVRRQALALGEETAMRYPNHTVHWDSYNDQGRDKNATKYLVYKENLERMKALNSLEYETGLKEILDISAGIMRGKQAVVL